MAYRITEEYLKDIYDALRRKMMEDKPYRSPTLSRDTLAKMVGTKSEHVSSALMLEGKTFAAFIAEYRITEVRRLLKNNPSMAIYQAAAKAGFGTPGTFLMWYGKIHGGHPSDEFRDHVLYDTKQKPHKKR